MAWVLKILGGLLSIAALSWTVLTILAAIGAYDPYPSPPQAAIETPHFGRARDVSFEEVYRRPGETVRAYEARLTYVVNMWMVHYWPQGDRAIVGNNPIEDLPLWLKSFVPGSEFFGDYEFVEPQMAWHRGFGWCSQVARIVFSVLQDAGIDATIVDNPQHVVVTADGFVLDADYGVVIPKSLTYLRAHPEEVETYYKDFRSDWPMLKAIYSSGFTETANKAVFAYGRKFEFESELWRVPLLAIVVWLSLAIFDAGFCWDQFFADVMHRQYIPQGRRSLQLAE